MKTIELRNHLYKMAEDSTLGWKYSSDHKAYMEMIDYHTGKVYALEHDVFDQEYSKGRRLNPCQIATFQDVPVIGVFDMRNVDEPDIWGNANYLKYIRKKTLTFQGKIDYLKDKLAKIEQAKSQFAFHVYEHVKEQCPNADATFKENLITMVGVPGFHLLEEAGYIELLLFSPTTMLKTSFMPSSLIPSTTMQPAS